MNSTSATRLALALCISAVSFGCQQQEAAREGGGGAVSTAGANKNAMNNSGAAEQTVPTYGFEVVNTWPHDRVVHQG